MTHKWKDYMPMWMCALQCITMQQMLSLHTLLLLVFTFFFKTQNAPHFTTTFTSYNFFFFWCIKISHLKEFQRRVTFGEVICKLKNKIQNPNWRRPKMRMSMLHHNTTHWHLQDYSDFIRTSLQVHLKTLYLNIDLNNYGGTRNKKYRLWKYCEINDPIASTKGTGWQRQLNTKVYKCRAFKENSNI